MVRIWVGFAVVWIVWWGLRLTVGGGLESFEVALAAAEADIVL